MNEQELRQLFQNLSDECKIVKTDGTPYNSYDKFESTKSLKIIKMMTEDRFIETLKQAKLLIIPDVIVNEA